MGWLYYLIEANIYLSIFYALYYFISKNETLYVLNRWYLLATSFLAFVLPFLTVSYLETFTQPVIAQSAEKLLYDVPLIRVPATYSEIYEPVQSNISLTFDQVLLTIYGLVALLFCSNLLCNLFKIVRVYRNGDKEIKQDVTYIKLPYAREEVFSFFNWLFLHPNLYENHAIIAHEKTHIKQGHSYDILFFELLRCLNWFNPLVYKLFTAVKLNHEYISDHEASAISTNRYEYAKLLIQHAYVPREQLSHSAFTQSQLEQRIKQLGLQQSKKKAGVKYLTVFPIAALLFFISAFKVEKSYGFIHFMIDQTPAAITYPYKEITPTLQQKGTVTTPAGIAEKIAKKEKDSTVSRTSVLPGGSTSELISGPRVLDQIAAELATQGKRLYARDYLMHWTINTANLPIRKVTHGVLSGTEAQLFRGNLADTLYVDQGYYKIDDQEVTISTDNLMIGYADGKQNSNKRLIIIDAFKRKIVHTLAHVDIRTRGTIYKVVTNPDFGYVKQESSSLDTPAANYVDMKMVNANYQYIMVSLNSHVREAKITANEIITNETRIPKEDPWQPGIIW